MENTEKDRMEKDNIEKESTEKSSVETKSKTETAGQFSADVKLKECKYCRVLIPKSAKICPNCKMHLRSKWPWRLLALFILAALCAAGIYYRTYLWDFVESVTAMWYTDAVETTGSANTVVEISDAGAGEEIQIADSSEKAQITDADAATQDADTVSQEKTAADTEDMEKISTVMDSLEAVRPEEKKDLLADVGAADADAERIEEDAENPNDREETRSGEDKDAKAADRRNETEISETEISETETEDETEEAVESREIDVQDYTEAEFRDICEQTDYKSLLRKQDIYLNSAVKQEVTVIEQVNGGLFDDSVYYLCMAEDPKGYMRYYIVRDDRADDTMPILEGDVLLIYGQLFDSCKLPADMVSTQPVVPALTMVYYELLDE